MSHPSAYHQLGRFIVAFQHLEGTVDVLFASFVDICTNTDAASKAELHKLMVELRELGERRKVPGPFPAFAKLALPSFRL